ncbi:MAG: hypothetical protein P8Y23_05790 [Candidatus Lokiarchaeota archaeon]|jgi:predicted metal-dependent HD superfamily phosphohydrolase
MKSLWKDLVLKYSNDLDFIEKLYKIIEKRYDSSNRHYHNLTHINLMLSEVKRFENRIDDYDSVLFAIWFHDIIYDPLKGDNEERSAECARKFLVKINYEKNRIRKIEELILRTKDHTIQNCNENYDLNLFLDLDLLILGMEREQYVKYAKNVKKEYHFVPDDIYNKEREKILNQYLNSQFIYKTKKFRDLYEKQARNNIKYEIDNNLSKY